MDLLNTYLGLKPDYDFPRAHSRLEGRNPAPAQVNFQQMLNQSRERQVGEAPIPPASSSNTTPATMDRLNPSSSTALRDDNLTMASLPSPERERAPIREPESPQYRVRQGDTLSGIVADQLRSKEVNHSRGELYGLVNTVARENALADPDRIFPGQLLDTGSVPRFARARQAEQSDTLLSSLSHSPSGLNSLPSVSGTTPTLQPPAMGHISSEFGLRLHPMTGSAEPHKGLDIVLPSGTPIKSVAPGTVTFAGEKGGYGLTVDVDHGEGLTSRYAHLSRVSVSTGEEIGPREIIGRSGKSGLADGPHLHLEIKQDNQAIDPLTMLDRNDLERGEVRVDGTRPGDSINGVYTVRPGDTLSTIAAREMRRLGVEYDKSDLYQTVQQLAANNGINNPDRIISGQRLNLASLNRHTT